MKKNFLTRSEQWTMEFADKQRVAPSLNNETLLALMKDGALLHVKKIGLTIDALEESLKQGIKPALEVVDNLRGEIRKFEKDYSFIDIYGSLEPDLDNVLAKYNY